jgi:AcrR family transcriptional regulator
MIDIHSLIFSCGGDMIKKRRLKTMRITKEPEVRKQEILDTALKLFGENGYEKTSITDIAKAIGVAQGLCYRYFPSKEALFDSAIEQYADVLVEQFAYAETDDRKTLRQIIEEMPATMEKQDTKYYSVFHGMENRKFHDQLALKVCEKLVPLVEKLLQRAKQKGEIHFDDLQAAATFCVYGQLGILLADDLTQEDKSKRIREFLIFALHL